MKKMVSALCYTEPADRSKSYLYMVGYRPALEEKMKEWNEHGNPDPMYPGAGEDAIYHIEMVEDYWG